MNQWNILWKKEIPTSLSDEDHENETIYCRNITEQLLKVSNEAKKIKKFSDSF